MKEEEEEDEEDEEEDEEEEEEEEEEGYRPPARDTPASRIVAMVDTFAAPLW